MGFNRRSTIVLLVLAATVLVHVRASTEPLTASAAIAEPLSCLQPVDGLTWLRWNGNRQPLDLWCHSVGRPFLKPSISAGGETVGSAGGEIVGSANGEIAGSAAGVIAGMRILSWNVHVGAGRLEALLPRLLKEAARDGLGLTILLQETFRTGDAVPERYPAGLRVPKAIRPRRPTMDVHDIAAQFGLSVAYVPSMRNGPATALSEREDRGNAIMSTEPLLDVRAIELPFGKQRRVAVTALVVPRGITAGPRAIRVVSIHFDTNGDRAAQAVALSERLTSFTDAPLFVGGDLNSLGGFQDDAVLAIARHLPMAPCGTGRTNRWPLRLDVLFPIGRLDYMFTGAAVSDLVRSCETLPDAYDSDHLPLLMTLRY
jgi:endonuclease/exonuclease/phosphatase family metal-dependent hydrolase